MIAIISHDAGGAEVLSSWLLRGQGDYCLVLEGPAINIFNSKLGRQEVKKLEEALSISELIVCGTGWQSSFEVNAIKEARAKGKRVVAFLDHWVNYLQRFEFEGTHYFPDEIWVTDEYAMKSAQEIFQNITVINKGNPYLEDITKKIKFIQKKGNQDGEGNSILYVCEPIREHALLSCGNEMLNGYTEESAAEFFFDNVKNIYQKISKIVIRPHPSESKEKYNWLISKYNTMNIEISNNDNLLDDVVNADTVVGCESMALVVGLLAGKCVISTIPFGGKLCSLPHKNINHMYKILSLNGAYN